MFILTPRIDNNANWIDIGRCNPFETDDTGLKKILEEVLWKCQVQMGDGWAVPEELRKHERRLRETDPGADLT